MSNNKKKHLYIEVNIKEVKLVGTYTGKSPYGYNWKSNFYKATDTEGTIYAINTSKILKDGDKIKAKVKGVGIFKGKGEMHLTRVTILERKT